MFHLLIAGQLASASRLIPDGSKPTPGGWNRIVNSVDGLADFVAVLGKIGVKFRNEIIEGLGKSQIRCEDPAGNSIELLQPRLSWIFASGAFEPFHLL